MELGCEGMGDFNTNSPYYPSRCYYPPGTPAPYTTTPAAVPPPRFRCYYPPGTPAPYTTTPAAVPAESPRAPQFPGTL